MNAAPLRPMRVGATQSNRSTPRRTPSTRSSGKADAHEVARPVGAAAPRRPPRGCGTCPALPRRRTVRRCRSPSSRPCRGSARAASRRRSAWMPPCTIGKSACSCAAGDGDRRARAARTRRGSAPASAGSARSRRARRRLALPGNDVIELHDHVGAEVALDAHHALGREAALRAVDVAAELDAVLVDRAQPLEREHLEAARVGEDRAVPAHEPCRPPSSRIELVAGPQVQVVRVREDHLRAHRAQIVRVERLHRGERADRHERRRLDDAVRRREARRRARRRWSSRG